MPDAAAQHLVKTFGFQVLNLKSNVSESGEVAAAAKVFTDKIRALAVRRNATVWGVLPGVDATRAVSVHMEQTLLNTRSPAESSWLYSTNSQTILADECDRSGMSAQGSRICH